jgi:flagellar basal-body rod protein FlgB
MQQLHLFSLASQNNQWLAARQTLLAGNVANANTPGYKALDIQPFDEALEAAKLRMTATTAGHMQPDPTGAVTGTDAGHGLTWETFHSGNNVSVEQELIKSNEVSRAYSLNTSIVKSFNRFLIASTKG